MPNSHKESDGMAHIVSNGKHFIFFYPYYHTDEVREICPDGKYSCMQCNVILFTSHVYTEYNNTTKPRVTRFGLQ